jgi:AraC-like DNA-binding protein
MTHNLADLQTANRHVAEGERRIACQRRRIEEQEGAGHDTRLSRQVLESFELTLELLIEHRDMIERELAQTPS